MDADATIELKEHGFKPKSRMRNVCFTLNNYTNEQLTSIQQIEHNYIILGRELGEEKHTPHIQGYIEFKEPKYFTEVHRILFHAHIEKRRGTAKQAADYCKKEGDFYEDGIISHQGSKAPDIRDDIIAGADIKDIVQKYPEEFMKYSSGIEKMIDIIQDKKKIPVKPIILDQWEKDIITFLSNTVPDRLIYWIADKKGRHGKSTFIDYIDYNYESVLCLNNAKTADIGHAWNGEKIILFDFPKSSEDHINYEIIEMLKNGRVFSPKYGSKPKHYEKPYVICFSNTTPDFTKLIPDRWHVVDISDLPQHI